ncbi:heterokaryon incompatibility protein-domain-containing protein [Lophiotrema nucula]|uniref:Heterokaryon incompatibility protein-domain-containing protein n=1 Tax=Lophiotrema nucula TaxID=690887 RepID=A0A6A5YVU6_9PLEO|nr:heterokaryon incompatibility protein-domain-containing protein [Lophiotrema nucula]
MESLRPNYAPLAEGRREIRLLHVAPKDPSQPDSAIASRFSAASLDDNPDYEALSYAWGDHTKEKTIFIDSTSVGITRNLHDALEDLQLAYQERTLWVDAVCINQADNEERTHQVSQMRHVYESASRVIAYLGKEYEGSDAAMEFLEIVGRDPDIHYSPRLNPHIAVHGMDICSEGLRDAIISFLDLDWWKRVWTVQEFALARNSVLQCGDRQLPGSHLIQIYESYMKHAYDCCGGWDYLNAKSAKYGIDIWSALQRIADLNFACTSEELSFLEVLESFRTRHSFDPRDKMYGMLALATGRWENVIEADYTKSTEDVYRALALAATERTGNLGFLSHCYGRRYPELRLPSWIPDWTAIIDEGSHNNLMSRLSTYNLFDASSGALSTLIYQAPKIALVTGVVFDTIQNTGPERGEMGTTPEIMRTWRAMAQIAESHLDVSTGAFWQTICGGLLYERSNAGPSWRRQVPTRDWPLYHKWKTWKFSEDEPSLDSNVQATSFDIAYHITALDRRFVVSRKGHLGFAPVATAAGDVIAILSGVNVPFILRAVSELPDSGSNICYEVIGDCYIHGVMDGEVFTRYAMPLEEIRLV